jgi:hypothetical protein
LKSFLALSAVLMLLAAPALAATPAKACHDAKGRKAKCPAAAHAPGANNPQPTAAMLAPTMRCHSMKTGKMVPCTDPNAQPVPVN